jgi:hypothetical protein
VDRVAVITGRIAAGSAQSGGIYGNQRQALEDPLTCHTWLSTELKQTNKQNKTLLLLLLSSLLLTQ